jgi:hypothetical protein
MPNGEDENLTDSEKKATIEEGILNDKIGEFWMKKKEM